MMSTNKPTNSESISHLGQTWCFLNWSPPKDATQGLIPPVPTATKNNPNAIPLFHVILKIPTYHQCGGFPVKLGIAVTATTIWPMQYTTESVVIVQNFPITESARYPPNSGVK